MLPEDFVDAKLELKAGKYTEPPNIVVVPGNRKSFSIEVAMTMQTEQDAVVVSPDKEHSHRWCVLDRTLKQVSCGTVRHGLRVSKTDPYVGRTLMGGAENPDDFDIELTSAKLKDGASYTLLVQTYGVLAALDFVALRPKKKAKARKRATKKRATKKSAKKTARRKPIRKAKPKRKKAAKTKKRATKKSAAKKTAKRKPVRKAKAKRKTAKRKAA